MFFLDNWVEVGVYFTTFKTDPYLPDSTAMEVYVTSVWLVTVLINNFYILIGYLWYLSVGNAGILLSLNRWDNKLTIAYTTF